MAPVLAGQYGPEGLEFPDGRPARNTAVLIRQTDGADAHLYLDKERARPGPNPVTTDSYGNLTFLVAPGEYDMVVNETVFRIVVQIHPLDPGFGVGGEGSGGYIHTQAIPVSLVQIIHGLPWHPGGVQAVEDTGEVADYDSLFYPQPGVIEVSFKPPFAFKGKVYLS